MKINKSFICLVSFFATAISVLFTPTYAYSDDKVERGSSAYYFVGFYRASTGQKYTYYEDCIAELSPVGSLQQFEEKKKQFKATRQGAVHLLDSREAALVYKYKTAVTGKVGKFRIEYGLIRGRDLRRAQEALDKRVKERPAEFVSSPIIELRWGRDSE